MVKEWRREGSAERLIEASPELVYALVSDVTTTSKRDLECCRCEWCGTDTSAAPGVRFREQLKIGTHTQSVNGGS